MQMLQNRLAMRAAPLIPCWNLLEMRRSPKGERQSTNQLKSELDHDSKQRIPGKVK